MKQILLLFCIGIIFSLSVTHDKLRRLDEESCPKHSFFDSEKNECVCEEGYYGEKCEDSCPGLIVDDVGGSFFECSGYGTCDNSTLTCACDSYAQGEDCSVACEGSYYDSDSDKIVVCEGHGTCSFPDINSAVCSCERGYYGKGCEASCPGTTVKDNELIECSNQGTCQYDETLDDAICQCKEGFWGEDCSNQCPGMIEEEGVAYSCNHHGECGDNGECQCFTGYYGEDCKNSCPGLTQDHNGKIVECGGHGTCNPETLQCQCNENRYKEPDCKCDDVLTCSGKGTCNEFGTCICEKSSGEFCSVDCDYKTDCNGHGICNEEASCQCVKNYYGDNCEKECNEETDCSGNGMCLHNGKCMCNEGYSGDHCESKSSVKVSSDLIFVIILFLALVIQLYLFYRQMKKPRFAEKLKTNSVPPRSTASIEMSTVTPPTPVEGGWTCPACTMVNPRGALKCSVCNTPKTKPVSNKPKRVRRAAKDMGLKVQPTEEKKVEEKKEEKVEEKKEKVEEKEEEKPIEKPIEKKAQTEELIDLNNHDGESEILKNDTIRITVMKKQLTDNQVNLLFRYYAVDEPLSQLTYTISTPKYITLEQKDLSSDTVEKNNASHQQVIFVMKEAKPLKIKIEGSYKMGEKDFSFQTGGLSLE